MENKIKKCIYCDNEREIVDLLNSGLDPNYKGGWPIRLAARHGSHSVVRALIQYGANPHLLGEAGASTLQLAVFSAAHWDTDKWTFLLSCCDSSQLADGAAVAIIFNNEAALTKILATGRCNTNIPTTLTGKTVETLAKGYKSRYLLNVPVIQTNRNVTPVTSPRISRNVPLIQSDRNVTPVTSPRISRQHRPATGSALTPQPPNRNLSPSVARFFHQTAGQTGLTPPSSIMSSPTTRTRLGI